MSIPVLLWAYSVIILGISGTFKRKSSCASLFTVLASSPG